jgi:hypothetical protein
MARSKLPAGSTDEISDNGFCLAVTYKVATSIMTAIDDTETVDDVWDTVTVDKPKNPESVITFTIEDDDLLYDVRITPKLEIKA